MVVSVRPFLSRPESQALPIRWVRISRARVWHDQEEHGRSGQYIVVLSAAVATVCLHGNSIAVMARFCSVFFLQAQSRAAARSLVWLYDLRDSARITQFFWAPFFPPQKMR